jgi:hypothetical protein
VNGGCEPARAAARLPVRRGLLASDERMAVVTSLPDIERYIRMRQM